MPSLGQTKLLLKQNLKWHNQIIAQPTMYFVQQNEVGQGLFSCCPLKQSKGTHNTQFLPPPLEPYVIVTHHTTPLFPYLTQFSYFSKVFALHLGRKLNSGHCRFYTMSVVQLFLFAIQCQMYSPRLMILCRLSWICSHIPYCLDLSELSASLYYHLCKQTQRTCSLLDVSRMNVERRMSLIASCQMSLKNLSSHASYNWGIWKVIILLFMFRACAPLAYSTITSLVLHRCLPAGVNNVDHLT